MKIARRLIDCAHAKLTFGAQIESIQLFWSARALASCAGDERIDDVARVCRAHLHTSSDGCARQQQQRRRPITKFMPDTELQALLFSCATLRLSFGQQLHCHCYVSAIACALNSRYCLLVSLRVCACVLAHAPNWPAACEHPILPVARRHSHANNGRSLAHLCVCEKSDVKRANIACQCDS